MERIRKAHECGVEYSDMLCLTFTNRAARGMLDRIRENILDHDVDNVYVGNVHRYCSRFLFDNALIPAETSVIDDDDTISILAQFMGEEEHVLQSVNKRRRECFDAVHLAALMYQIEHGHPKELRIHPECLTKQDVEALQLICKTQKMLFTPSAMAGIYRNARDYIDIVKGREYRTQNQAALIALLQKMELADFYDKYKRENRLVDFEDILLITYDYLARETALSVGGNDVPFKRYSWCQVDEVQDLNPLQLRIIDLLMVPNPESGGESARSIMFLGDEQQAIFSFMGAKLSTLAQLKERCRDSIFHLAQNHRSPKYLLDIYNAYAEQVLKIDKELLPTAGFDMTRVGNELSIMCSNTLDVEYADAAQQAQRLAEQNPRETTAVIVLSNADADMISKRMDRMSVAHFKVSGTDMFSLPEVKLLTAHLSVYANEHNFIAWARLLTGLHVYERNASARKFMSQLVDKALLPTDLMLRPGSSYVREFAEAYESHEIIVFDTETTGLDTREDDILQIAAVKMRRGEVVAGSEFSIFLETEREIPLMLGNIANPVVEERKKHRLYSQADGLRLFMDYAGQGILLGHNASFDYSILACSLRRYLPGCDLRSQCPVCFDSLKLARLLEPQLHRYKLVYLLEKLQLEGVNSHLADADVMATCSLVRHCYRRSLEMIPLQDEFLSLRSVRDRVEDMRRKMLPVYRATLSRLDKRQEPDSEALLATEMRNFYSYLVREAIIQPVRGIEYAFRYISRELVDVSAEPDLRAQISNHILDFSTLKESDLCSADIIDERIILTTVHKAKGLEFDNVIIFDAADDRYPSFFAQGNPALMEEDARKFYVALTRARKRILLLLSGVKFDYHNRHVDRHLTRFMKPVLKFFTTYIEGEEVCANGAK